LFMKERNHQMERYLLFDVRCLTCNSIAQSVEESTNGWVRARSLHDPEMQVLLARTKPHWKWVPTLLEVDEGNVQAYTGFALRSKFLFELGPRRTLRTIQGIREAASQRVETNISRRRFFSRSIAVLGGVLVGIGWRELVPGSSVHADSYRQTSSTSHLTPDVARNRLTLSPTFHEATYHLGEPDWGQAYTYQSFDQSEKGMVIFYPSQKNTTTFLAIDDPQAEKHTTALIGRLHHKKSNSSELEWYTYQNELVATQVFQDRQTTVIPSAQQPASPDFNYYCFITCLGSSVDVDCAINCLECVLGQYFYCILCALCAGPKGVQCAKMCK
jgi:hypothetical protein